MITKLSLNCIASFPEATPVVPTKVNYIYGANGSGKTTISRVIANPSAYPNCEVEWKSGQQLQSLVYNRDFVQENFRQDSKLKGIFTLGKATPEIEAEIEQIKKDIDLLASKIDGFKTTLTTKNTERNNAHMQLIEDVWEYKKKYETIFRESLSGSIKTKELFLNRCKEEQTSTTDLLDFQTIEVKYNSVYGQELSLIEMLPPFQFSELTTLENAGIYSQSIIGKNESQVGELIGHLQNSDWVNKGIAYFQDSGGKCPFCQQDVSITLQSEIENFFDLSYKEKQAELKAEVLKYTSYVDGLIEVLESILSKNIRIYKFVELPKLVTIVKEVFGTNKLILQDKINAPSTTVTLKSIVDILNDASNEVSKAAIKITEHNRIVSNVATEKQNVKRLVWKYIASESASKISAYNTNDVSYQRGIQVLTDRIKEENIVKVTKETKLRELEGQITSVIHSVREINRILKTFHFNGFKLAESEVKGHYTIIRSDNSNAKETLSEGEFTFITFLYFFHLVKGSLENTGIVTDRVIAIDDPISSLDSNILFIVSNLIKSLIKECKSNSGYIKQIFVLTHNIYFHKEVTFLGSRDNPTKEESYWLVRKLNNISRIKAGHKNQVQTAYELLWAEIRDSENLNSVTVFNTFRRILEYYFKIIGDVDYEKIVDEFEFEDKQSCKALISWINDGSHFVNDDLLIDTELESMDRYLSVFKDIFDKLGHISHYNMMMKIPAVA